MNTRRPLLTAEYQAAVYRGRNRPPVASASEGGRLDNKAILSADEPKFVGPNLAEDLIHRTSKLAGV